VVPAVDLWRSRELNGAIYDIASFALVFRMPRRRHCRLAWNGRLRQRTRVAISEAKFLRTGAAQSQKND
jgi:hypothetical protein